MKVIKVGTSLCDQIGSGAFVALYLSGGVISSFASLAFNVALARFHVSSLGASGAVYAIVAAYAYINPQREFFFFILPFFTFAASTLTGFAVLFETAGLARAWYAGRSFFGVDHMAHLSGLLWGSFGGMVIVKELQRRAKARQASLSRYFR